MKRTLAAAAVAVLAVSSLPLLAEEPVDLSMMTRIRDEGLHHSQVMETLYQLTDVIGPRLTGSPQLKAANEWTRGQFESWGLANAHLEGYPFGRGWSFSACQVRMVAPRTAFLSALPKAWTPGTNGPLRGPVFRVKATTPQDLEAYRGKVAGKILLLDDAREFKPPADTKAPPPEAGAPFDLNPPERYTREDLDRLSTFEYRAGERDRRAEGLKRFKMRKALQEFVAQEKALATVEASSRNNGVLGVAGGGSWETGKTSTVPGLVMSAEHYNELLRLLDHGQPVELEIEVAARFTDDDPQAYDTLADIPGTDKRDELVMAGAHLDSWHAGTGATDNAAGSAVVMEAARILKALGVKPRRTIRFALWSGEEQGYFGSIAYVRRHFAAHPESPKRKDEEDLPAFLREETWPLQLKPEHAKISAYFNLDNGSGRIRGIYTQENAAVKPIFAAWLAPFADLGADTVTLRDTGSTDHVQFDGVGIPGFQFLQDQLDYFSHTHHSDLDTYDHVQALDMMQASVIMAAFLYDAAMRPELLPRKPLPQAPPKKADVRKETTP
ncbi:MAG TPA: M20/M25/M40 family metallo-hydrolase [Thermoanaerobaculia bacterium]